MYESKFGMEDVLKDRISGFQGVVMSISFYATGCTHYGLMTQGVKDDGTLAPWEWLDESRLECVNVSEKGKEAKGAKLSGPTQNAPEW